MSAIRSTLTFSKYDMHVSECAASLKATISQNDFYSDNMNITFVRCMLHLILEGQQNVQWRR